MTPTETARLEVEAGAAHSSGEIVELRQALSQEERDLLILRVDRQLEWTEIARIFTSETGAAVDDQAEKRAAARLRKRFQLVKERLREMAEKEGLLDPAEQ